MPIVVRHDPDYLSAYAQLAAQQSSRQQQNYEPTPDADVNPYTMSTQKGASIASKLAADRERLGQKQKKEYGEAAFKDSAAGFDWLTPISINGHTDDQGRPLNTTVYRNDGKDPLATGAWGALGSAEHQINDPGGVIDPRDFRDRQAVEALSRTGISGDVSEDPFLTPEQREDKKFNRGLGNKRKELELSDEFAQKKEGRNFANNLALDEIRYKIQEQREQNKLAGTNKSDFEKAKGAASAALDIDFDSLSGKGGLSDFQINALKQFRQKRDEILLNKDGDWNEENQAGALKQIVKKAEDMLSNSNRVQYQREIGPDGKPTNYMIGSDGSYKPIQADYNTKLADKRADKATDMEAEYKQFQRKELYRKQLEEQFKPQGATPAQSFQAWREAEKIREYNGQSLDPNEIQKDAAVILNKILGNSGSVGMSPPAIMNQGIGSRNPIVIPAEQAASTMQTILKLKAQGLSPDQIREKLRGQ